MTNPPTAPVTPVPEDAATPAVAPVLVVAPGDEAEQTVASRPDAHEPAPERPAPARLPYRLLTGPDDRRFCERVSAALADGYRLYGSPAATFDGERVIVAQAVVLPGVLDGAAAGATVVPA